MLKSLLPAARIGFQTSLLNVESLAVQSTRVSLSHNRPACSSTKLAHT